VGSLFVERKFLRGLSLVGHIEDIAVDKKEQGRKVGLRIIQALVGISEGMGCYKTILNCSDKNIRKSLCIPFHLYGRGLTVCYCSFLRKVWIPEERERNGTFPQPIVYSKSILNLVQGEIRSREISSLNFLLEQQMSQLDCDLDSSFLII
jgi:hypothetical protein